MYARDWDSPLNMLISPKSNTDNQKIFTYSEKKDKNIQINSLECILMRDKDKNPQNTHNSGCALSVRI